MLQCYLFFTHLLMVIIIFQFDYKEIFIIKPELIYIVSVAWQTIHILRISICYRLKDKNKVFIGGFSLFIRLPWISRLQRYSTWRLRSYLRPYTWNYLWIQLGIFIVFTYKICSKNVSHELKQIWSEKW